MSQNPISVAFEHVDVVPSAVFRHQLRGQFIAAMLQLDTADEVAVVSTPHQFGGNGDGGDTATVIEVAAPPRRRSNVVLGVAASICVVAALTVVILSHRSEPNEIDTTRDPARAKAALLEPKQVGVSWQITHQWDSFTSRDVADVAASVPACDPYLDYAFDSPNRKAITAGRILSSAQLFALTQWVYIFPTKAAATQAMDKIAEPAFVPCFTQFMAALFPKLSGGLSNVSAIEAPPLAEHGDRMVVLGQSVELPGVATFQPISAFVQVGRGIVYVNPTPDSTDGRDPASRLDRVLSAAVDDLATALDSSDG